jgi:hypothetical protein
MAVTAEIVDGMPSEPRVEGSGLQGESDRSGNRSARPRNRGVKSLNLRAEKSAPSEFGYFVAQFCPVEVYSR